VARNERDVARKEKGSPLWEMFNREMDESWYFLAVRS
jgi:hypothetical protein